MRGLMSAVLTELIKTIKSRVFTGSLIFTLFVSFMLGILFFIVKNPEFAQASVIIRAKASIVGNADWKIFFDIVKLMMAIIRIFAFGFITTWTFGREYADKTLKDLLSLPVPREKIVIAKFMVIFLWSIVISILLFVFSIVSGIVVGFGEIPVNELFKCFAIYVNVALMNVLLATVVAFLSVWGRGYILPLAFIFLTLLLSNFIINISENSKYFPWAIPLLYAGGTLKEATQLDAVSFVILVITGLAGLTGTLIFVRYADQY